MLLFYDSLVRPEFGAMGIGRLLTEAILEGARQAGYACLVLGTLSDMETARTLYRDLGFEETPPYFHNPISGSHCLKGKL